MNAEDVENLGKAIAAVKAIPTCLLSKWRIEWAPNVWQQCMSRKSGRFYFRNCKTQQTQWHQPRTCNEAGAYFYIHIPTNRWKWTPPELILHDYPSAPPRMVMYNPYHPSIR